MQFLGYIEVDFVNKGNYNTRIGNDMAKKIFDENDNLIGFAPGWIYELRFTHQGVDIPFYVGETTDHERRLAEHIYGAKNADSSSEAKYQFIAQALDANSIPWTLVTVAEYGSEGPEALEDEHMMALLVDGFELTNEKKGNANWMTERLAVADDMRERGIRSFREYKATIAKEGDGRTPEQIERLARVMTGIMGSAEESYQWAIKHEKRQARRRAREAAAIAAPSRLHTIAQQTIQLATTFPVAEQIRLLQDLYLTYQEADASEELLQMTMKRLEELEEFAK